MSNAVTITISGDLDYDRIASISRDLDPARRVVLDLTKATGGSSTHIAACVQVAIVTGRPVTVRGCSERFAVALGQMRLGHLVRFQDASASAGGEQSSGSGVRVTMGFDVAGCEKWRYRVSGRQDSDGSK